MLRYDFADIAPIALQIGRAYIVFEAALDRSSAGNAFLQHLDADAQNGHWVKRGQFAAKVLVLFLMHMCHHLHQALRAHRALGKWIEA